MRNKRVMQVVEDDRLEVAIETLNASITRWTEKGEQHSYPCSWLKGPLVAILMQTAPSHRLEKIVETDDNNHSLR